MHIPCVSYEVILDSVDERTPNRHANLMEPTFNSNTLRPKQNEHHFCRVQFHIHFNSSPPGQNGRHFADDIFRCIFVNEMFCILLKKKSLNFIPKGPIDNNQALVKIMACCRIDDKPLSEPMLTRFTDAFICGAGGDELIILFWFMFVSWVQLKIGQHCFG